VEGGTNARVREGLSSISRGTLFLLIATLCYVGLTFASRVIVIRSISPSDWNAFALGLALSTLLSALGTLGLPNAIARNIPYAQSDDERRAIVRGGLIVGSLAAFAVSLALWSLAVPISQALNDSALALALEYFSIAVGTSIVATLVASVFQGYEDVVPNALFLQIVNPALFVGFLAGALLLAPSLGVSYGVALAAYAFSNALTLALLLGYTAWRLPRRLSSGAQNPTAFGRLVRFAAPLFVTGVLASVIGSGDTLVLGVYHPTEVGTYAASVTLARLLMLGLSALSYIYLPVASKFLAQHDAKSVALTFATSTKWMALFSLPLFLAFFFLPGTSLELVYGANYTAVVLPLQIVSLGAFVTTLLGPTFAAQISFGHTRLLIVNGAVAAVTDVALSLALAPSLGYVGAAIAWASANVAFDALSLAELALMTGTNPIRRNLVVPLLATALPVGGLLFAFRPPLSIWLLPGLVFGIGALYLFAIWATQSADDGDRLLLEAVEQLTGRSFRLVRKLSRGAYRKAT
jgi:O-antigen/teichoic acid export membrane protein